MTKKITALLLALSLATPAFALADEADDAIANLLRALSGSQPVAAATTAATSSIVIPTVSIPEKPKKPEETILTPMGIYNIDGNAPKPEPGIDLLKATLASLMAQFASLSSKQATTTGATSTASTTPNAQQRYQYKRNLDVGSRGADVTELQKLLIGGGYLFGEPTGYFGIMTKTAVIALQTERGLEPVGSVGPKTRALLNATDPEEFKHLPDQAAPVVPPALFNPVFRISSSTSPAMPNATSTGTSTPSATSTPMSTSTPIWNPFAPPVSVSMSILPTEAPVGGSVAITWLSANATSCEASDGWSGPKPTLGAARVEPLQFTMTFVLTCYGAGGAASTTQTVVVGGEQ